jgi:hypothetical protein
MNAEELQSGLDQCCGSEHWYRQPLGGFTYTDGVKFLAVEANAYWLIDLIASHQKAVKRSSAADFQVWELRVESASAVATCRDDDKNEVVRQEIPYTDFPLPYIKLWLTDEVLLLPSEY